MSSVPQRPNSRWWKILKARDDGTFPPFKCPANHRFDDPLVWNDGGLRCGHKGDDGKNDCNALVLVLGGGLKYNDLPCFLLVEVTSTEMNVMKRLRMNWDRMTGYLGLNYDDPEPEAV